MAVRQPRYSKAEFARRGDAIYESQVRSHLKLLKAAVGKSKYRQCCPVYPCRWLKKPCSLSPTDNDGAVNRWLLQQFAEH